MLHVRDDEMFVVQNQHLNLMFPWTKRLLG